MLIDGVARLSAFFGVTIDDRRPDRDGSTLRIAPLPYRQDHHGEVVFLLLSPRAEGSQWTLPEGWPLRALTPRESAGRIAMNEAGVRGLVMSRELGRFPLVEGEEEEAAQSSLIVYPIHVRVELPIWRRQDEIRRRWFTTHAATAVLPPAQCQAITTFVERSDARVCYADA